VSFWQDIGIYFTKYDQSILEVCKLLHEFIGLFNFNVDKN